MPVCTLYLRLGYSTYSCTYINYPSHGLFDPPRDYKWGGDNTGRDVTVPRRHFKFDFHNCNFRLKFLNVMASFSAIFGACAQKELPRAAWMLASRHAPGPVEHFAAPGA